MTPEKEWLRQTYGMTPEEWEKACAAARRRLYKKFPFAKELAEEAAKTNKELEDEIIESLKRACDKEAHEE